jgi:ABC-type enterochelin transport system substrate-binding protein
MSSRLSLVVLALATSLAAEACQSSSSAPRADESAEAAAAKEAKAAKKATKERDRFRVLVTKEIAWADRRIVALTSDAAFLQGGPKSEKERDTETARAWQQRLRGDLEALDPAVPVPDWPALKARIERDLDVDRPPSMPRLYEKAYGI